jgi:mRNA interferase HigB
MRRMRIIARKALVECWERHADAQMPLRAWFADVRSETWLSFHDVKRSYATASRAGKDRIVFNMKGNTYRLVVAVDYERHLLFVKFIGTHADYSKIDAATVSRKYSR